MYIENLKNIVGTSWSGGTTKEIYRDKEDFDIRISSAVIEIGASKFSDYSGYKRILKVLENEVNLKRGNERIKLNKENIFLFDGHEDIFSENDARVLDFNIIFKANKMKVSFIEVSKKINFITSDKILIFSLEENSKIKINKQLFVLDKYDFIILEADEKQLDFLGNYLIITWNPILS